MPEDAGAGRVARGDLLGHHRLQIFNRVYLDGRCIRPPEAERLKAGLHQVEHEAPFSRIASTDVSPYRTTRSA